MPIPYIWWCSMLKLGDKDIKDIRFGDKEVQKVFVGDRLVWERGLDWSKCIVDGVEDDREITLIVNSDFKDLSFVVLRRLRDFDMPAYHDASDGNYLCFGKVDYITSDIFDFWIEFENKAVYAGKINIRQRDM